MSKPLPLTTTAGAVTPHHDPRTESNSWAQDTAKKDETARDPYQYKPMPPIPKDSSPSPGSLDTGRKARNLIKPAASLLSPSRKSQDTDKRSISGPVTPSKPSISSKLRKTLSLSRHKKSSGEDDKSSPDIPEIPAEARLNLFLSPPVPEMPMKAKHILGVDQERIDYRKWINDKLNEDNKWEYPRIPARVPTPPTTLPQDDPFSTPAQSLSNPQVSLNQDIHPILTPSKQGPPTTRYYQETKVETPGSSHLFGESAMRIRMPGINLRRSPSASGMILGDGTLNPTRHGTYGRRGEVEYVDRSEAQRAPSVNGVIDNAGSSREGGNTEGINSGTTHSYDHTLRHWPSGELLLPVAYSPGSIAGVWANNPQVGRTLPPFSPHHPSSTSHAAQNEESQIRLQNSGNTPVAFETPAGGSSHRTVHTHSLRSQNSWAASANGTSGGQQERPSAADTAASLPSHLLSNSVPPPPQSYPGFVSGSTSSLAATQMEQNLHHHLQTVFGALTRSTTDTMNRTVDKILRHNEDLQNAIMKELKDLKTEVKDMKKDMSAVLKAVKEIPLCSEKLEDTIKSLDKKFDGFEHKFDEVGGQRQSQVLLSTPSPLQLRQPHQRSASQSSAMTRHNSSNNSRTNLGNSNQARRTNTASGQGTANRTSNERTRREFYTAVGVSRPAPDIRDHPAYRGAARHDSPGTPIYQQDFSNWYERGYAHDSDEE